MSSEQKIFIVYRVYDQSAMEARDSFMKVHLEYQEKLQSEGKLKIGFKTTDGVGAYHFFFANNEDEVKAMIEGDPHCQNKVYTYKINEVTKLRGTW